MLRSNPARAAQSRDEAAQARREKQGRNRRVLASTRGRAATMGPATTTPVPKTVAARNPALLEMARGRTCLLCTLTGQRLCHPESTVAAHSNLSVHGKAGARRADDHYSAWLGDAHHRWLDQGAAPAAQKLQAFMAAHGAQVDEWRRIVHDRGEPARYRRAAAWALERLNATPVIDLAAAP
jgi:hypothetical protein